ncbi:GAF domain-containing protein, partial [bacterium]
IVGRIVDVMPNAKRGALLLHSRETDALLLAGFRGTGGPAVSETLARRAMVEKRGLLWRGEAEEASNAPPGASIARFAISSALVAPLLWRGEAMGVLCLDNPEGAHFSTGDLRVLMIVAHHIGMALANRRLAEELRRESNIKANLLRQFSPQYREQLLNPAGLQLSGERGEVTILVSDIRGFEALTRHMEPVAVIEMLNDYFSRLSPIIWAHNGSIDKYIGDAILAVFGSPNKDPKQHENALRAALEMQADMARSNAARAKKGKVTCEIGIGVHCGEALHGFMGVLDQFSLTVIGDAVNRAGRYCDGAKSGEIMLSPQVYQWVWKDVEAGPAQIITKHGETLPAFRLLGFGDPRD